MKRLPTYNARKEREATVCTVLQALTADGTPAPLAVIAARAGLRPIDTSTALHDLEERPGSGPLFIDGGYVWVQIGPQAAD